MKHLFPIWDSLLAIRDLFKKKRVPDNQIPNYRYIPPPPPAYYQDNDYENPRPFPSSTSSLTFCGSTFTQSVDLNIEPLKRYVKRWFPFILDITSIQTKTRRDGITISMVVSPTHFSETFSNNRITIILSDRLNEKLTPLLRTMFPEHMPDGVDASYVFFPEKSETLLELL